MKYLLFNQSIIIRIGLSGKKNNCIVFEKKGKTKLFTDLNTDRVN